MIYLVIVVCLLLGGALTIVGLQNLATPEPLWLFFWQTPAVPLGIWLVGSFLLGAILLYVIGLLAALGERRELKRLRGRVAELESWRAATQLQQAQARITGPLTKSGPLSGPLRGDMTGMGMPMPGIPSGWSNGRMPPLSAPETRQ